MSMHAYIGGSIVLAFGMWHDILFDVCLVARRDTRVHVPRTPQHMPYKMVYGTE